MGDGRTVVVTGGTGGLGRGVCRVLCEAGLRPVVTWVVEGERDAMVAEFRDRVELRRIDVVRAEEVRGLAAALEGEGRAPWGLAHLVGGYLDGDPVAGSDGSGLAEQLRLNLTTTAVALGAFLPGMVARGGGRAVAVSSRAAVRPFAGGGAYAASKAGVIALVQAASEEVKHEGVTVNCVLPSVIDTPANRRAMPDADRERWVTPEQIGHVMAFLLSDGAAAVTGAAIPVYGRA
jgi:NAD(P)-dependent dehydrogenase (short-subunit alcohol dehydrogenase family)